MVHMTIAELTERIELADQLHFGREQNADGLTGRSPQVLGW